MILEFSKESVKLRNAKFLEAADKELKRSRFEIKDIALYFFPVCRAAHYFLVCFNTLLNSMDLIDWVEGFPSYCNLMKNLVYNYNLLHLFILAIDIY